MQDEIERLEHMQANLHGHIKRLEDEIAKLNQHIMSGDAAWAQTLQQLKDCRAENAKLRDALSPFAAHAAHVTGLTYTVPALWLWNARAALQKDET